MPLRFRLEDLSPSQQAQVRRQLSPSLTQKSARDTPTPCCRGLVVSPTTKRKSTRSPSSPKSLVDVGRLQPTSPDISLADFDTSKSSFSKPVQQNLREDKMSSTEKAYLRDVLHGNGLFEAITLKSPSGNRYTPDWLTIIDGIPTLIEIKGNYRLDSEGRAHTAFLEAASNFSSIFQFLWVRREKGGKWTTKIAIPKSSSSAPNLHSSALCNL